MGLLGFLFKTDAHKRLAVLLWVDGLTASVHELSLMAGLPYATAHELLQKMLRMKLVLRTKQGRATLFSSNLSEQEMEPLRTLLGKQKQECKSLTEFDEMDLPLVGDFPELKKEKAQDLEELLVKVVFLAKENATLLRSLPLLVKKMGTKLNAHQLNYWSRRHHVDRELGFVLDLTSKLSGDKKFAALARTFKDKRWSQNISFLNKESNLSGFQAKLVEQNTPKLAKKWFLTMNMGLDSFESMFAKFA